MNVNVGQKIIAAAVIGAYPHGAYDGKPATVTEVFDDYVVAEFQSIQKPDDTIALHVRRGDFTVADDTPAPVEFRLGRDGVAVPADASIQHLRDIIERLSNDLADSKNLAEQRLTNHNRLDEVFKQSIGTIGAALMEEAERRGWCSEYDELIDSINADLPSYELPTREREYTVTWEETYTVTVHRSGTYTASSEEDAIEMAQYEDTADTYDITSSIDAGNYEFESADCYEAEEQ